MNPQNLLNALSNPITQQAGTQTIDIASQATTISPIQTVGRMIEIGAGALLTIGGLAVLVFLLLAGFNWVTAGGDKGKIESARNMITQAIIGIAVLASVFAVYRLVLNVLGVNSIGVSGGTSQSQTVKGTVPSGLPSGCCDNTAQCKSWYGSISTCTNLNGACASGVQCAGSGNGGGNNQSATDVLKKL